MYNSFREIIEFTVEHPSRYLDILVDDPSWDNFDYSYLEDTARMVLAHFGYEKYLFEICLYLTGDAKIQKLNLEYRGKNNPTNVLSFEGDLELSETEPVLLGSIAIAYSYSFKEAEVAKVSFKDHITHLFIHGMLHLLGYDHIEDEDFEKMKALEILFLEKLNIDNPYEE